MTPVLFVNRTYWPGEQATAQFLTDLAGALAAQGRRVSVLTASVRGRPDREEHRGVTIFRTGALASAGRARGPALLIQARAFLSFNLAARKWVSTHDLPGVQVVLMSDPPLIGTMLQARLQPHAVACHHWIQDIYPEIAMDRLRIPGLHLFQPARDRAWKAASTCVTVSQTMAQTILARGVPADRVRVIPNWAPREVAPPDPAEVASWRAAHGLTGGFVIGYAGNLGRVHTFDAFIAAADQLRGDARFQFVFIGDGAQRGALDRELARRRLKSVRFLPGQPREKLSVMLSAIDLHLVSQRPGCEGWVFPSKLYGIAAVGRPVLSIGVPGAELGEIVKRQGFGWHHTVDDVDGIVATLRSFASSSSNREAASDAARAYHRSTGGFEKSLAAWNALLAIRDLRPGPAAA
ncbi:MAG: glycosyltransferase family 4 protein [Opitutaceae bacterium]